MAPHIHLDIIPYVHGLRGAPITVVLPDSEVFSMIYAQSEAETIRARHDLEEVRHELAILKLKPKPRRRWYQWW
jgi:hypothetical protein